MRGDRPALLDRGTQLRHRHQHRTSPPGRLRRPGGCPARERRAVRLARPDRRARFRSCQRPGPDVHGGRTRNAGCGVLPDHAGRRRGAPPRRGLQPLQCRCGGRRRALFRRGRRTHPLCRRLLSARQPPLTKNTHRAEYPDSRLLQRQSLEHAGIARQLPAGTARRLHPEDTDPRRYAGTGRLVGCGTPPYHLPRRRNSRCPYLAGRTAFREGLPQPGIPTRRHDSLPVAGSTGRRAPETSRIAGPDPGQRIAQHRTGEARRSPVTIRLTNTATMKTFRYLIAGLLLLAALPSQSKEEEISVSRSWGKLSGTLTVPDEGSDAAVLIIAGSGPTDRNGNSGSGLITNTYYMLARALEKEGIASLRYDKQGIGGSRYQDPELYKQEDRLRLADYIADAEALTDYLKERGFRKIILAGHSEGSLVALVAATESPDVAAVISLAGAGYPIDEILQFQLTRELISYNPGLILNVQSILSRLKQGKTTEDIPAILQGIFRPSVQPYLISWMQYDPREVIRQVKQPVLIVNGDNDIQISADNAEALAQARPDADKVIIEGMTHLLKQSEVTDPQRQKTTIYMDAAAPVSEKLVSVMADFIRRI